MSTRFMRALIRVCAARRCRCEAGDVPDVVEAVGSRVTRSGPGEEAYGVTNFGSFAGNA